MSTKEIKDIDDEFLDRANAILSSLLPRPVSLRTNSGKLSSFKILEIYVHTFIASVFKGQGWDIEIGPKFDNDEFYSYRGAPGRRSTQNGFNYFIMSFKDAVNNTERILELDLGVEVVGCSGLYHELDVLIRTGNDCNQDLYYTEIILATEVKRYNSTYFDKSLAREFVGVLADMNIEVQHRSIQAESGNEAQKWAFFIATSSKDQVDTYLNSFNINTFSGFSLNINRSSSDTFCKYIEDISNQLKRQEI